MSNSGLPEAEDQLQLMTFISSLLPVLFFPFSFFFFLSSRVVSFSIFISYSLLICLV